MSDDDRPKRSWRDIDRGRDHSVHRPGEKSGGGGARGRQRAEQESRRHKADLERVFSGGGLPEHLAKRLEDAPGGAQLKVRTDLIRRIKGAAGVAEAAPLIDEFLASEGVLPRNEDVLIPAIEHPDEEVALSAIALLSELLDDDQVKRRTILKSKLQGLAGIADDPDVDQAASALLAKL